MNAICKCFESEFLLHPSHANVEKHYGNQKKMWYVHISQLHILVLEESPVAWQGQFQDKDKNCSMILEAIADQSLWILHAFCGIPEGTTISTY